MRCAWIVTFIVGLVGACVGGAEGDETLGLACSCGDGASSCAADEVCGDLTCIAGLCSRACDLGLQDCPEGAYCTLVAEGSGGVPLAGAWCRPQPLCLSEAGIDEGSLLIATEAIGLPCAAPPLGDATIEGHAFGGSFPAAPQRAFVHALEQDSSFGTMLHIGADLEASEFSGQCTMTLGSVALTVTLPCGALRLGAHEVGASIDEGAVTVEVLTPTEEGLAVSGVVVVDGYDPDTRSLCGSIDVTFDDGDEGRLMGELRAATPCR